MSVQYNHNKWPGMATALISVVGIYFFSWSVVTILFVYWLETVVVGVFNIVRMLFDTKIVEVPTRRKPVGIPATWHRRIGVSLFFCLHFGIFLYAHRFFIKQIAEEFNQPLQPPDWVWYILVPLLLQHVVAYCVEKRSGTGEKVLMTLFTRPYLRIVVQQFVVIASSIPLIWLDINPKLAAAGLVVIKVGSETLIAHMAAGGFVRKMANMEPNAANIKKFDRVFSWITGVIMAFIGLVVVGAIIFLLQNLN